VSGLRLARADEAALVRALSAEAYGSYRSLLGFAPLPATEDYAPRIAAGQVWLLEEDGAVVGLAVLETHADHMMVYSLAVPPARQGEGLGRRLLAFAEERARVAGVAELRLYTNTRMAGNIALYAAAGYREIGRRPHPTRPGALLVDMAKVVPA